MPKHFEVWFVGSSQKTSYLKFINDKPVQLTHLAQNEVCQKVGDYCFDPQKGLYHPKDTNLEVTADMIKKENLPQINDNGELGIHRDLISCDNDYLFDVFCGKAKKNQAPVSGGVQVWIDISGTMKNFDSADRDGDCYRRSFYRNVHNKCPSAEFSSFHVKRHPVGSGDIFCTSKGSNDTKSIIRWIKNSKAETLILITDIYEYNKELSDFIELNGGVVRGESPSAPLSASELPALSSEVAKKCKSS